MLNIIVMYYVAVGRAMWEDMFWDATVFILKAYK
jgi:hypothetical protein